MLFKSILIADLQKKEAFYTSFSKGVNVVTSDDNHVGKSSLIKGLFHSLGADCEYDKPWNLSTKLFVSWIKEGGRECLIARHGKRFCVLGDGEILLVTQKVGKDLAPFLEEMFSFHISALDKNTKMHRADPVLLYLPYYIDQDLGWGSEPFVSFSNINQFLKKDRLSSLYSHLGHDERDYSKLENEKAEISEDLKRITAEKESLKHTLSLLNDELTNYVFDDKPASESETTLEGLFDRIGPLMEKVNEHRVEIQNNQRSLAHYGRELDVVEEYSKVQSHHIKNNQTELKITCPNCGYEYGETIADSIRAAYGAQGQQYVKEQIQYLIAMTQKRINSLKKAQAEILSQIEIEKMDELKESDTTEDYIRSLGLKNTIGDIEQKYDAKLLEERKKTDRKNDIAKQLAKRGKERKKLDAKYSENLQTEMMGLGVWNSDFEGKIGIRNPATIQGSAGSKAILADYLSFFTTRSDVENPGPDIPFVVDSPRTKEASDLSSKQIMESIKSIEGLLPQIIVATTEFKRLNEDLSWDDVNIIFLERKTHLLTEQVYADYQETIESVSSILKMAE